MGAAFTKNVSNTTVEAVTEITNDILNNQTVESINNQGITIKSDKGDIVVSGNKITQNSTIQMDGVLKAMVQTDVQSKLSNKLAQKAKSLVKDINFGQFTFAENVVNSYVSSIVKVVTNISNNCSTKSINNQSITVNAKDGRVVFTNNTVEQLNKIYSNCLLNAISSQSAVTDMQQMVDQSATAESIGVSIWGIVAVLIVVLLIIIVVVLGPLLIESYVVAKVLINFLFPILTIAGIVFIIIYARLKDNRMSTQLYGKGLSSDKGCSLKTFETSSKYKEYKDAQEYCSTNKNCIGLDFKQTSDAPPKTTFYNGMKPYPCAIFDPKNRSEKEAEAANDNTPFFRDPKPPIVVDLKGQDPDYDTDADVIISKQNGKLYYFSNGWKVQPSSIKNYDPSINKNILVGELENPHNSDGGTNDIYLSYSDFMEYKLFIKTSGGSWKTLQTIPGPGRVVNYTKGPDGKKIFPPSQTISGYKIKKSMITLYIGIPCLIVGLIGMVVYGFSAAKAKTTDSGVSRAGANKVSLKVDKN